jgi:hypothetical protein
VNLVVDYKCEVCGITGVKLWRMYQSGGVFLRCCDCVKDEDHPVDKITPDGLIPAKRYSEGEPDRWTDQIGWYIPACPVDGEDTYWGYSSTPASSYTWWLHQPVRPPKDGPLSVDEAVAEYAARCGWVTEREYRKGNGFSTISDCYIQVTWEVVESKVINGVKYTRERLEERLIDLDRWDTPFTEQLESLKGPVRHVNVVLDKTRDRVEELTKTENLR